MGHGFKQIPQGALVHAILICALILSVSILNASQNIGILAPQSIVQLVREHVSGMRESSEAFPQNHELGASAVYETAGNARADRFSREWSEAYYKAIAARIVSRMIGMDGALARDAEAEIGRAIREMPDIPERKKESLIMAIHAEYSSMVGIARGGEGAGVARQPDVPDISAKWHGTIVQEIDLQRRSTQEAFESVVTGMPDKSISVLIYAIKGGKANAETAMDQALRMKRQAMVQGLRRSPLIHSIQEVDSSEDIEAIARKEIQSGRKLVLIDLTGNEIKYRLESRSGVPNAPEKAGPDYCVIHVIENVPCRGAGTIVPLIDIGAIFRLGVGVICRDENLIFCAYKQITGDILQRDLMEDLVMRRRWIIDLRPRAIPISDDAHGYDLMRKIFEISV